MITLLNRTGSVALLLAGIVLAGCTSSSGVSSISNLGRERPQAEVAEGNPGVDTATTAVADTRSTAYIDGAEADLRRQLEARGVKIERAGNQLIVSIPSAAVFDPNRDQLRRGAQPLVGQVAALLKKYERTTVDVYGHTDSRGNEKQNLDLTQRRALAVARQLAGQGVDSKRLSVTGFGGSRPVGPNDTAEGREQNRRIEIQISPARRA